MSVIRGARERARAEVTAVIKDEARRQLSDEGAAKLSLRAVARALGMASSALYRYFPSRDELLTALIVDAYDAMGEAAEGALTEHAGASPAARWTEVCGAIRAWALAHPHEYALLYGSPVPGYAAPQATVGPASRAALALVTVVEDAHAAGALEPGSTPVPAPALRDAEHRREELGLALPAPVLAGTIAAWAQLFGLISFDVFGHFRKVVDSRDVFFAHATARLAHGIGLSG